MTETIRRTFPTALERSGGDQRTLGGCCVPYSAPSTVSDDGRTSYREMFAPGCFGRQLNAARRIALTYRHGDGIIDTIGRATQLDEEDGGLFGMFRIFDGMIGDHALTLVDEGMLPGLQRLVDQPGAAALTAARGSGPHLDAGPLRGARLRRRSRDDAALPGRAPATRAAARRRAARLLAGHRRAGPAAPAAACWPERHPATPHPACSSPERSRHPAQRHPARTSHRRLSAAPTSPR